MNIFLLDIDPVECAKMHCDKHVVKMILESAQMLSSALRSTGVNAGYKETHVNHPCTLWVKKSIDNYLWLYELVKNLNAEWQYRYGHTRNHKSYDMLLTLPVPKLPSNGLTEFAQAMPQKYRHPSNPVIAYRSYYIGEKSDLLTYTRRPKPYWLSL